MQPIPTYYLLYRYVSMLKVERRLKDKVKVNCKMFRLWLQILKVDVWEKFNTATNLLVLSGFTCLTILLKVIDKAYISQVLRELHMFHMIDWYLVFIVYLIEVNCKPNTIGINKDYLTFEGRITINPSDLGALLPARGPKSRH